MCDLQVLIVVRDPKSSSTNQATGSGPGKITVYQSGNSEDTNAYTVERALDQVRAKIKEKKKQVKVFTDEDYGALDAQ